MTPEQRHDAIVQTAAATPSILAIVATKLLSLPIEKWLGLAGIGFIVLQAAYLLWRWRRDIRRERLRGALQPDTGEGDL